MSHYQVIHSGFIRGDVMIKREEFFLKTVSKPLLHLYRSSQPTLTYGRNMQLDRHIDIEALNQLGISAFQRLTPGGALFHLWDLAFSLLIPLEYFPHLKSCQNEMKSAYVYKFINKVIKDAIMQFLPMMEVDFIDKESLAKIHGSSLIEHVEFCMSSPTRLDVMIGGRKIAGVAQIIIGNKALANVVISICAPDLEILAKTVKDHKNIEGMIKNSFFIPNFPYTDKAGLAAVQSKIEHQLVKTFEEYPLTLDN